mmetsp:Transcript_34903/g.75358  ORF Transcript_34903/g.75358 Transcript_34903/m.75358 type:complete len:210 (-) Transcript_34903:863-1492(-)
MLGVAVAAKFGKWSTSPPVRHGSQCNLEASPSTVAVTSDTATPVRQQLRCISSKKVRFRFFRAMGDFMGVLGVLGEIGVFGDSTSSSSGAESSGPQAEAGTVAWKRTKSPPPKAASVWTPVRKTLELATSWTSARWKGSILASCPSWPGGASAARSATSSFKVDSSCKNISFPSGSATCTPSDSGLTGTNGSSMSGITTARKRPWLVGT